MSRSDKQEVMVHIISIVMVMAFLIVTTWCWYLPHQNLLQSKAAFSFGYSDLEFIDISNGIVLENAFPVSDKTGLNGNSYIFEIVNHGSKDQEVTVGFITDNDCDNLDNCNILANNYIRYSISDSIETTTPANLPLDGAMHTRVIPKNSRVTYELKFWIDGNAGNEIMNKYFNGKVGILNSVDALAMK